MMVGAAAAASAMTAGATAAWGVSTGGAIGAASGVTGAAEVLRRAGLRLREKGNSLGSRPFISGLSEWGLV
jgi:hypothetical protein